MAYVQRQTLFSAHPGASYTLTLPGSSVSGNGLFVAIEIPQDDPMISVTDNKGNTFVQVAGPVNLTSTFSSLYVYLATGITGGSSHIITVNRTNNTDCETIVEEHSGIASAGALDRVSSSTGTSTSVAIGPTATTRSAIEEVFVVARIYAFHSDFSNADITVGSGYSNLNNLASAFYTESKTTSITGAQTGTYTIDSTGGFALGPEWAGIIITAAASQWLTKTQTHTTSSFTHTKPSKIHSTDALRRGRHLVAHGTNALLGHVRNHTTDSLKKKRFTKTHTTSSSLKASNTAIKPRLSIKPVQPRARGFHST